MILLSQMAFPVTWWGTWWRWALPPGGTADTPRPRHPSTVCPQVAAAPVALMPCVSLLLPFLSVTCMSEASMMPAYVTRQSNVATSDDASVMLDRNPNDASRDTTWRTTAVTSFVRSPALLPSNPTLLLPSSSSSKQNPDYLSPITAHISSLTFQNHAPSASLPLSLELQILPMAPLPPHDICYICPLPVEAGVIQSWEEGRSRWSGGGESDKVSRWTVVQWNVKFHGGIHEGAKLLLSGLTSGTPCLWSWDMFNVFDTAPAKLCLILFNTVQMFCPVIFSKRYTHPSTISDPDIINGSPSPNASRCMKSCNSFNLLCILIRLVTDVVWWVVAEQPGR